MVHSFSHSWLIVNKLNKYKKIDEKVIIIVNQEENLLPDKNEGSSALAYPSFPSLIHMGGDERGGSSLGP
jgi:hypothetical protein